MSGALGLDNLLSYGAQVALVTAAGSVAPALLRLRVPRVMLVYWQALLAVAILLPVLQPWQNVPASALGVSVTDQKGGALAPGGHASLVPLVGLALLVGSSVRVLHLVAGLWALRRYRLRARSWDPGPQVTTLRSALGIDAAFLVSEDVSAPATFGLRRPVILVPPRVQEMPPDRQLAVAVHEMLHVRRRDWLFAVLEELAAALLWFHPALWWLRSRIRLTREQAVDAGVVRVTGAPQAYLEALLDIARTPARAPAFAPPFLKESHLKQRVHLLLEEVSMPRTRVVVALGASAAAVLLSGALAVWSFPLETPAAAGVPGASEKTAARRRVVRSVPAVYPEKAKQEKVEGNVVLEVTIEKSGEVSDVRVLSGPESLAKSAVAAVRQWRYEPSEAGRIVATVTIRFSLAKDTPDEKSR